MQGDIDRFVMMSPVEKRQMIEEDSGIYVYEQKKNDALTKRKKVDEKVR